MTTDAAWPGEYPDRPLPEAITGGDPAGDDGPAQLERRLMDLPPEQGRSYVHVALLAGTLALGVLAWWMIPRVGLMSTTLISTPLDTLRGLWSLTTTGSLATHFAYTMAQVLAAFVLGVLVGLVFGTVLALSPALHRIFTPYILALRSLPVIVVAPLLIAWFGFGVESKIATGVIISFLPTMINTMVGLRQPSQQSLDMMRALRASPAQIYRKVRLPAAMPLIFVGLKYSLLLSFTGVLVAEMLLGGSTTGLGTLIRLYSAQIRMDLVYAVIIVLTLLSVLLVLMFDWVDRRLVYWRKQ